MARGVTLSDSDVGRASGAPVKKDDTALAADLGLSASAGGVPSPGRSAGSMSGSGLSSQGSRAGVNVFGADEIEAVDPMAQTSVSSGVKDQVNLEGVGSGSGLLDLTRESDDTSLGAELLDEISPGAKKPQPGSSKAGTAAGGTGMEALAAPSGGVVRGLGQPTYVEAADAMAPAFGGASLGAALVTLVAAFILASAISNAHPSFLGDIAAKGLWVLAGGGAVVAAICFIIGLVVGKSASR